MVTRLADRKRPFAFHRVATDLAGITKDQRVSFFQAIFTGNRMREGRALPEGHKASEWRIDADTHNIVQLGTHFLGQSVGCSFKDIVFRDIAVALDSAA